MSSIMFSQNIPSSVYPEIIGGVTPTSTLKLQATKAAGATGADIIFDIGNNGATEAMRITNSGFVGIGTTMPTTYLSVGTAGGTLLDSNEFAQFGKLFSGNSQAYITIRGNGGGFASPAGGIFKLSSNGQTQFLDALSFQGGGVTLATSLSFRTDGSEIMNLTAGKAGIGTVPAVQFHTTGAVRLANFGAGAATFDSSGNVSSVSDERLKSVRGEFKSGLEEIKKITPILYNWTESSGMETENTYAGFSAQNVLGAVPEAVDSSKEYYSLQDRALLAVIVNAIKELDQKIEAIEMPK